MIAMIAFKYERNVKTIKTLNETTTALTRRNIDYP